MMCEFEMFLMMWTGKVVVRWWCRTDIYYLDDCLCTEASKSDLNVATKDIAFRERLSAGCHTFHASALLVSEEVRHLLPSTRAESSLASVGSTTMVGRITAESAVIMSVHQLASSHHLQRRKTH